MLLFLKLKAMLPEIYAGCAERGNPDMAIFHYTIKIVGRSKGKSVISASAYLNGDVSNGVQGVQTRLKRKDRFESK